MLGYEDSKSSKKFVQIDLIMSSYLKGTFTIEFEEVNKSINKTRMNSFPSLPI